MDNIFNYLTENNIIVNEYYSESEIIKYRNNDNNN